MTLNKAAGSADRLALGSFAGGVVFAAGASAAPAAPDKIWAQSANIETLADFLTRGFASERKEGVMGSYIG